MVDTPPVIVEMGEVLNGVNGTMWKVKKLVGAGAYGAVVEAKNMVTGEEAALKMEDANQEVRTLRLEVGVLEELGKVGAKHCCKLFDRGRKGDRYNWVAMTLVGQCIQALVDTVGHFSIGTSIHIAIETLESLEEVHSIGYLHRDVKPGNFAIGRSPNERTVIILDFGMARKFLKEGGKHRRARDVAGFRGTPYYASPVALFMGEQGRRDDLWSWLFMTIEMTTGTLPWINKDYENIEDPASKLAKMGNDRQALLFGDGKELLKKSPEEYKEIFNIIKKLEFTDKPPYKKMYKALRSGYSNHGISPRLPLDYEEKLNKPKRNATHPAGKE